MYVMNNILVVLLRVLSDLMLSRLFFSTMPDNTVLFYFKYIGMWITRFLCMNAKNMSGFDSGNSGPQQWVQYDDGKGEVRKQMLW